jgi:hypothetical protein
VGHLWTMRLGKCERALARLTIGQREPSRVAARGIDQKRGALSVQARERTVAR